MKGTIRPMGISEERYPLSRLRDGGKDTKCDHVTEGLLFFGLGTVWALSFGCAGQGE